MGNNLVDSLEIMRSSLEKDIKSLGAESDIANQQIDGSAMAIWGENKTLLEEHMSKWNKYSDSWKVETNEEKKNNFKKYMDDRKRRIEDLENYENYKSLVRKVGQSIKQIPLIPCLFTLRTLVSQAELASEHKEGTELNKIEIGILNQAKDIAQASYTILNDAEKFDFVKNYEEIKQRLDIKFYQGN